MRLPRKRKISLKVPVLLVVLGFAVVAPSFVSASYTNDRQGTIQDINNDLLNNADYAERSPNPGSMRLYRYLGPPSNEWKTWASSFSDVDNPSTRTGFKHVLKHQDTGTHDNLTLQVFYTSEAAARNARYRINTGGVCEFQNDNREVIFSINGVQRYNRGGATACGNGGNKLDNNEYDAVGDPIFDYGSDRWLNTLEFRLDIAGTALTSNTNQMRFQVMDISNPTPRGVFSIVPDTLANDFAMVEGGAPPVNTTNPDYSIAAALKFGRSCAVNTTSNASIKIYDADAAEFGSSFIAVFKQQPGGAWVPLNNDAGEYVSGGGLTWLPARQAWHISGGNNQTREIIFSNFNNRSRYMVVYDNPAQPGYSMPTGNIISLSLPGATIYGQSDLNCNFDLFPEISGVPTTFSGDYNFSNIYASIRNLEEERKPGVKTVWALKTPPWKVTKAVFASDPANKSGTGLGIEDRNNCQWLVNVKGGTGCTEVIGQATPGDPYPLKVPNSYSATFGDSGSSVPAGQYVCYITSIRAPLFNQDSGDESVWGQKWRHSDMQCAQASKKPRVQFLGGDLRVNGANGVGGIATSQPLLSNGLSYGSWAEYGVFTLGNNLLVASGNGLRNGNNGTADTWNKLTFANTNSGTSSGYGGYGPLQSVSPLDYFQRLPASGGGFTQTSPTTGVYDVGANPTISAIPDLPNGRSVIIRASGTLTISGDIFVRNTGVVNAASLSQVVFVADSIVINDNVTNVDAWLVTTNSINTCTGSGELRMNMCNQQLNVNGPVYTRQLMLRRTAGGDPVSVDELKKPAERFNLRPDAQLWAYTYANKADFAQTDFIQELPPRY